MNNCWASTNPDMSLKRTIRLMSLVQAPLKRTKRLHRPKGSEYFGTKHRRDEPLRGLIRLYDVPKQHAHGHSTRYYHVVHPDLEHGPRLASPDTYTPARIMHG